MLPVATHCSSITNTMSRSDDAIVNEILNEEANLLSNFGHLQGLPEGSEKKEGFSMFTKFFCDSIIFWGLYNGEKEDKKGTTIGKYIAELRDIFAQSSLVVDSVKLTHCGHLDRNDETFPKCVLERHQKECGDEAYKAKYMALKVSLDYSRAKRVVLMLANALPLLAERCIVLHDIDFARDCCYITTRGYLVKHITDNKAGTIVKDRHKVGDHCISWKGTKKNGTESIRFKVYNKFIQALESADVRKSLGSRMENLVEKEGRFAQRLELYKNHGYTRIELTFYGPKLQSLWDYSGHMDQTMELLSTCTTFECSFEDQWRQRAECISSMVAVHFPKEKLFAYCHWWNSITSKKYGYMWRNVSPNVIPLLLANYSFNDHPIYYLVAVVGEDGHACVEKKVVYERVPGCMAMTLVAGGAKGMFPSRNAIEGGARKFSKVGIIKVNNIKIGWPKREHDKRTPPLAEIVESTSAEDDTFVKHLKSVHSSSYTADYNILQPDMEYTIVAAGLHKYRNILEWHAITQCGVKLHMGKSLRSIWVEWIKNFVDAGARMGNVDGVERMTFIAKSKVRNRGKDDIKCELVY
jgi:hypothetical protein